MAVIEVGEDRFLPFAEGAPQAGEFDQVGLGEVVDPNVETLFGLLAGVGLINSGEGFFEPPGQSHLGVVGEEPVEGSLLVRGEGAGSPSEQPAAAPYVGVEAGIVLP